MLLNDCFDTTVRTKCFNFGHGKLRKVMEKEGHGILKSSESTKPGLSRLRLVFTSDGVGFIRELMT